ncbi:hypothetical protein M407DRAFT_29228 [Tulasnella calospora MUT 4182]|uniref:Protein kinase domain-containing protein n=1 Tax=Tulasnella calospora MUT 4182 TaxID=1051891 RepID=A0A0C3KI08_9AGAM|nr:hypothetical protein M407DRAFT_29228 [Tulasnella calospora MUT 4182]
MEELVSKFFEPFQVIRWLTPTPTPQTSTNHQDTGGLYLSEAQQKNEDGGIDETNSKKLSARERLDRLPTFRINPNTLTFVPSGASKGGGKAAVVQATFYPRIWSFKTQVAVKKLRGHGGMDSHMFENAFVHEVEMMAGLSHKNIARFVGFIEDLANGKAWIIMSWESNGNVSEFLEARNCEIPERMSLIQDTFEGLQYLHNRQPPICHGDLNSTSSSVHHIAQSLPTLAQLVS